MTVRTAARSLGVLALTGPLAVSVLLITAPAAHASGSITSPGADAVISSGPTFTTSASVGANSATTTLKLDGPGGYTSSKSVNRSLTGTQTISISVSTGEGNAIRNGQWTASLTGGASGTRTFFTNFAPDAPTGLSAQGSGARDVSFTWTKGSEPDLSGYALYDGSGNVIDGDISMSACSGSNCSYGLYYPTDNAGTHAYQLAAKRASGGCSSCGSSLESGRSSASATLVNPPPPPPPSPSASPEPDSSPDTGGTTGGTTGGSSTGGSTGGSSTGGSSTGGSSTGGSTTGGGSSTSGSSTGGTSVKPGPKPTLPSLADPIVASRRAFALRFNAFSPSLGIPKLPPLPAITLPAFSEGPLPQGTYNPQLPYQPQSEVERSVSFTSQPIAAVRDALDSERLARSIAGALILLLVGAHLRRYLGTHVEE